MIFKSAKNLDKNLGKPRVVLGMACATALAFVFVKWNGAMVPSALAQDWGKQDSAGSDSSAAAGSAPGRRSDGGMKKVAGVPLPGGREAPPAPSTSALPGRKSLPAEPSTMFPARSIFLNGMNIGSVRDQDLENVTVKIDGQGNIHLIAPHYDVREDTSYHPLLPQELPRFPKAGTMPEGMPQGPFSKQSGEKASGGESSRRSENDPRENDARGKESSEGKGGSEGKRDKESKDGAPPGFMPVGKPQMDPPPAAKK